MLTLYILPFSRGGAKNLGLEENLERTGSRFPEGNGTDVSISEAPKHELNSWDLTQSEL